MVIELFRFMAIYNGGSVLLLKKREVSYYCLGKLGYFQRDWFPADQCHSL